MSGSRNHAAVKYARLLWLALYAQRAREFSNQSVRSELGIKQRTFLRYVTILREAGCIIDFDHKGNVWRFYCWDARMAPVLGAADALRPHSSTDAARAIPLMGML
jgi:predicted DNA-binding transcriptional regulator YafY